MKLSELKDKAEAADFWADNITAQANMKQQAKLEAKITPWLNMNRDINDILELSGLKDMGIKNAILADGFYIQLLPGKRQVIVIKAFMFKNRRKF